MGSGGRNESNNHELRRIGEKKISLELNVHHVESRNLTFLGSGCRIESNTHEIARIGEKKISFELDVHHV